MNNLERILLNGYKSLYRENPNQFKGAGKISKKLNLSKEEQGHNYWRVHNILQELQTEGYLEQKHGYGFRKKCCSNHHNIKQEQSIKEKKPKRENTTILQKKTLIDLNISISQNRVHLIYEELQELEVEKFRNAVAVLFRVFLELSVDHYITKKSFKTYVKTKNINIKVPLYKKIKIICKYMREKNILTKSELNPVYIATAKYNPHSILSTKTFNNYVHNLDHIPSSSDLKTSWSNFKKFFQKLWE